jgi:hypothetical protein
MRIPENENNLHTPRRPFPGLGLIFLLFTLNSTPTARAQVIIESLKSVDENASLETALNFAQLWHSVSCCLRKSPDVEAAQDFFGDAAREFDFQQVYESGILRQTPDNDGKKITFLGEQISNSYQISINSSAGKSPSKAITSNFGNAELTVGLKKFPKQSQGNDVYDTLVSGEAKINGFKPSGFLESAKKLLLLLSPQAVASRKSKSTAKSLFSKLDPDSRAYMDQYTDGLPRFTKIGTKYFKIISLFEKSAKISEPVSFISLKMGLNNVAMARDYPELNAYLESLRDVLHSKFEIRDMENRLLMKGSIDSSTQISSLQFYTSDGKLIPQNSDKTMAMSAAVDIADGVNRNYTVFAQSTVDILGLKMDTGRTQILVKTNFNGGSYEASSKIIKITDPKVTGRMFYVLPTWFIDVTIPGDIQERVNRFAKVLSNPKVGRGAEGVLRVPPTQPRLALVSGHAELLDNNVLRLGMKVGVDTLIPNEAAQRDIKRIDEVLSAALMADLRALVPNNITGSGNTTSKSVNH